MNVAPHEGSPPHHHLEGAARGHAVVSQVKFSQDCRPVVELPAEAQALMLADQSVNHDIWPRRCEKW